MDEQLQHDPRTKSQIKDLLYAFLYEPVEKQFKAKLDGVIMKNSVLLGASHNSFIYKGIVYACDQSRMPRRMNQLVPQLHSLIDEYLKEAKQLNYTELPYVMGYINQVLNSSNDLHDYLRLFPASIHRPIEKLIAECPCRTKKLTEDAVELIQQKNQMPIQLIKQRMATNLLI